MNFADDQRFHSNFPCLTKFVTNGSIIISKAKPILLPGLELGIISLHTLQQELALKQVKVLNVEKLPIMRIWYIMHHKQKVLSLAMELFKQFVIEQTQEIWVKKYPELLEYL